MMAPKMLLVRVDLAGIGFVLGVSEATVLVWLRRAAHQDKAINQIGPLMLNGKSLAMIKRPGVFWPSV